MGLRHVEMELQNEAPDQNVYLSGNFAPVTEEVTAFDLEVIGELPADLNGRYLRNGPNPITAVDPTSHHWFMGDGMVHGIRLLEGGVELADLAAVIAAAGAAEGDLPPAEIHVFQRQLRRQEIGRCLVAVQRRVLQVEGVLQHAQLFLHLKGVGVGDAVFDGVGVRVGVAVGVSVSVGVGVGVIPSIQPPQYVSET